MNKKPEGCVLTKPVCTWLLPADYEFIRARAKLYNISPAATFRMIVVDAHVAHKRAERAAERSGKKDQWYDRPGVIPKVVQLLATTMTSEQIAGSFGVSRHAFERLVKRHGLGDLAARRKKIVAT